MMQKTLPSNEDRPVCGAMGRSDRDTAEFNLAWLLKARELAKTDRAKAAVLFGLDQGLSDVLATASIPDLRNLAQSGLMLYRPRFHVRFWRRGCVGDAPSSPWLTLESLMLAAAAEVMAMRIDLHARAVLAISLIRRGMRTSIVGQVTGVHPVVLRELNHEIHRRKPASAQLPSSGGVLCSPLIQASASAFASLYRALAPADIRTIVDNRALVEAHDLYLEQVGELASAGRQGLSIDINHAWIIACDQTTGVVRFRFCQRCRIHYVVADFANAPPTCSLCALKRGSPPTRKGERRGRAAGGSMNGQGAGSSEGMGTS